jgi:hypothetical protein
MSSLVEAYGPQPDSLKAVSALENVISGLALETDGRDEHSHGEGCCGQRRSSLQGQRVALNPDTVQQDLARLVLGLVEVVRQLMEKQALRRVEGGRLAPDQIERLGLTLMRLEERMEELKEHFGVKGDELCFDLSGLIEGL